MPEYDNGLDRAQRAYDAQSDDRGMGEEEEAQKMETCQSEAEADEAERQYRALKTR
jgi:hypothetical protein